MKGKQLTALLFLFFPVYLFAWGHRGHEIVAELAMRRLSPEIRQKVQQVLGTMTPAEAGTWMDDVRGDTSYKYMAPWHYTNIEKGESYQPSANGDIITALFKAYTELQHMERLSPKQLRFDVLVLFHLCGDLTQPLHVGYGSDKGGNDYQVQYNGKGTNLHRLWDSEIIESQPVIAQTLLAPRVEQPVTDIQQAPSDDIPFMQYLSSDREKLQRVYKLSGHKVDSAYIQDANYLIEQQLRDAGYLLATCLRTVFIRARNIPIEKVTINPQAKSDTVYQELLVKVPAEQAANYIGKRVSICGKVYSTKFQGSGVTFINMGGEYPNNPFTAVIMANNRSNFNYKPEETLNGKVICITGTVKEYKGKPEIVVEKQEQIQVQ